MVARTLEYGGDLTQSQLTDSTLFPGRTVRYALTKLRENDLVVSRIPFTDAGQQIYPVATPIPAYSVELGGRFTHREPDSGDGERFTRGDGSPSSLTVASTVVRFAFPSDRYSRSNQTGYDTGNHLPLRKYRCKAKPADAIRTLRRNLASLGRTIRGPESPLVYAWTAEGGITKGVRIDERENSVSQQR